MRRWNLCHSAMLKSWEHAEKEGLTKDQVVESPNGFLFQQKEKGVLPIILTHLLDARKQAKRDMKAAKDPLTRSVHDGRQLALKVVCNSV